MGADGRRGAGGRRRCAGDRRRSGGRWRSWRLRRFGLAATAAVATVDKLKVLGVDIAIAELGLKVEEPLVPEGAECGVVAERNHLLVDNVDLTVQVEVSLKSADKDDGVTHITQAHGRAEDIG
jgi:hypothetical protein